MDYREFAERVKDDLPGRLTGALEGADVRVAQVDKLQGQSYEGISVMPAGDAIGVSIDLAPFFGGVETGLPYSLVVDEIARAAEESYGRRPDMDLTIAADYSRAKENLVIGMVGIEGNKEMLSKVPHQEMEDLAIVYRIQMGGMAAALVTDGLMERYGVTQGQLHQDALESTQRNAPFEIKGMGEILAEMAGMPADGGPELLYVASNADRVKGAGVIAYPGFMDAAAEKLGGDFFVLPSSIHEVILAADNGALDAETLKGIVRAVNMEQVAPGERLTDSAYHYDSVNRVFEKAEKFEERAMAEKAAKEEKTGRGSVLGNLSSLKKECAGRPRKEPHAPKREAPAL